MKLTPRKDKPCAPTISTSECGAGLKLVQHILGRIVESGRAPEQVVERAHEFELFLGALIEPERKIFLNSKDRASLDALIVGGTLPTLHGSKSRSLLPQFRE